MRQRMSELVEAIENNINGTTNIVSGKSWRGLDMPAKETA